MLISVHSGRVFRLLSIAVRAGYGCGLQCKSLVLVKRAKHLPALSRAAVIRIELAFAAFAKVPYFDARTKQEFNHMFAEFEDWTEEDSRQSTSAAAKASTLK